tara:strand:- start:425 stop:1744 length:1320 start_codon:yes stop_codon:yes gene_type:complete
MHQETRIFLINKYLAENKVASAAKIAKAVSKYKKGRAAGTLASAAAKKKVKSNVVKSVGKSSTASIGRQNMRTQFAKLNQNNRNVVKATVKRVPGSDGSGVLKNRPQLPVGSGGRKQLPVGSGGRKQLPVGSGGRKQLPVGSAPKPKGEIVVADKPKPRRVPSPSGRSGSPVGSGGRRQLPVGSGGGTKPPAGSGGAGGGGVPTDPPAGSGGAGGGDKPKKPSFIGRMARRVGDYVKKDIGRTRDRAGAARDKIRDVGGRLERGTRGVRGDLIATGKATIDTLRKQQQGQYGDEAVRVMNIGTSRMYGPEIGTSGTRERRKQGIENIRGGIKTTFGTNKRPKLDDQGNQVLDKEGNPVMVGGGPGVLSPMRGYISASDKFARREEKRLKDRKAKGESLGIRGYLYKYGTYSKPSDSVFDPKAPRGSTYRDPYQTDRNED